jgi:hypothetical protein
MLPNKWGYAMARVAPYGFFILLFFLATGLLSIILNPAIAIIHGTIAALFGI